MLSRRMLLGHEPGFWACAASLTLLSRDRLHRVSTVAVIILVGNKTDLAELREVSAEEGQEYASQCARPARDEGTDGVAGSARPCVLRSAWFLWFKKLPDQCRVGSL